MSWIKTNMKMSMEENPDVAIAGVMTDGCNMGVKSLHRYLNQYGLADQTTKDYTKELISTHNELGGRYHSAAL